MRTLRTGPASTWARACLRVVLAGPLTLAATCLAVVGAALWLPPGRAQVDNLVLPVVLFPLLWTVLFLYACVERRIGRAYLVMAGILAMNALLLAACPAG